MLINSNNGLISSENKMGGQDNCLDLCSGNTSCIGYNYGPNDTCSTYSSIDSLNSTDTDTLTGVKMDSGDFIEKFQTISNDDSPNLSLDNTSYLDTIISNQQTTLNNLKDLTSENELRNRNYQGLIESKKDIANTMARSLQIEQEHLIYKNKIVYSMIALIFVVLMIIIILYKIKKI